MFLGIKLRNLFYRRNMENEFWEWIDDLLWFVIVWGIFCKCYGNLFVGGYSG